jgi:transposase
VFSRRKLETATYDFVAFRFIAANTHPEHDTLASFRRWFLDELAGLFVQVLEMTQEMQRLKLGTVCLNGTKIHTNTNTNTNTTAHSRKVTSSNFELKLSLKCKSCWHWLSRLTRPISLTS